MSLIQMSKQQPIPLPQICAPRTELMQSYEAAAKSQYIYVHASAGYGKTISTLLWLKKTARKAIWLSLDSYDNALVLFYRLFCISMLSEIPHNEELIQKVKSAAFSAAPVESTIDLITLLDYEDRYAFVLDDFHMITNEEIKKSLPFILKRLPLSVTVLILSRNIMPDSFTPLIEQQKLSCIDSVALAFNRDEIKKHFAEYGRFITKDEADKIYSYTEGWIIALNAIAASGNIDVAASGSSLSFNSYIEKNIWNKLDGSIQVFLLITSVPDKFTLELCQYLTDDPNCSKTLDTLLKGNINISMISSEYRYHNLFLEFLRNKLAESALDKPALNKRVAEYYLQKSDFLTAKNYAMKSYDPSCISRIVRSFFSLKTFSIDEYIEFHKLYGIHSIPESICEKSPILYVPRIFYAYASGDIVSVSHYFDMLYPLLERIAEAQPEVMEHVNSMIMLDCRMKLSEMPSRAEKLPPIVQGSGDLQSPTFTLQMPFLHRCVRDFYELRDPSLRRSIHDFSSKIIKQNVDIMFRSAEAGLLMEQNKLHEAHDIAVLLIKTVTDDMSPEFVYAVYILAAEASVLLRRRDRFEALIKDVKAYITRHACQYLYKNLSAYESRIQIEGGEKAAAEKWLSNYFIDDSSFGVLYKIYRNFTTVRAYILLGQLDKAHVALSSMKALAISFDRPLDVAEADVLLAIVEWASGKKKEARYRLQNTIRSIYRYRFIRIIANEGKSVLPILSSVIKQIEKEDDPSGGLAAFSKDIYMTAYEQAKHFKGLTYRNEQIKPVLLSPQQKRVLELLAKGHKNAEIVRETGLSINTIRTHTKLAYQKLEVNNSFDAVIQARHLGMIE